MVAGTFLSGPLMFVSAKMISAATVDTKTSEVTLNTYEFDISAINIFALVRTNFDNNCILFLLLNTEFL